MEKSSFVVCPICNKQLLSLSTKHLRSHNIKTIKELKRLYPNVIVYSEVYLDKKRKADKNYIINNKEEVDKKRKEYRIKNRKKLNNAQKKYCQENAEAVKERNRKYANLNKDKKSEYDKQYAINNAEKIKLRNKNYRKNNKKIRSLWEEKYHKKNPHIRAWRRILKNSLRDLHKNKSDKTIILLGYSALGLKNHIELLFTEGMSWDNYGEWHIDHIKQIVSFDKKTPSSIVNALSNLRPLWATTREINGIIYEGNLNRNKYKKN